MKRTPSPSNIIQAFNGLCRRSIPLQSAAGSRLCGFSSDLVVGPISRWRVAPIEAHARALRIDPGRRRRRWIRMDALQFR